MAPQAAYEPIQHAVKGKVCGGHILPKIRGSYVCLVCDACGGTVGAIDTPVFDALFPSWRLDRKIRPPRRA